MSYPSPVHAKNDVYGLHNAPLATGPSGAPIPSASATKASPTRVSATSERVSIALPPFLKPADLTIRAASPIAVRRVKFPAPLHPAFESGLVPLSCLSTASVSATSRDTDPTAVPLIRYPRAEIVVPPLGDRVTVSFAYSRDSVLARAPAAPQAVVTASCIPVPVTRSPSIATPSSIPSIVITRDNLHNMPRK